MDDEDDPAPVTRSAAGDDGTSAVLYGMFTSFTEVIGRLDGRLQAMEVALRSGPRDVTGRLDDLDGRLRAIDAAVTQLADAVRLQPRQAEAPPGGGPGEVAELAAVVRAQSEQLDRRIGALAAAIDDLRALLQAHADDAAHSLGRRAGEAGRRLAADLGLRTRPKGPSSDR